jgi:hypothetical protein
LSNTDAPYSTADDRIGISGATSFDPCSITG